MHRKRVAQPRLADPMIENREIRRVKDAVAGSRERRCCQQHRVARRDRQDEPGCDQRGRTEKDMLHDSRFLSLMF